MSAPPPVFIVSGGAGTSGEQVVNTVLAQFPDNGVPVVTLGNVRLEAQIEDAVGKAKSAGGLIVHTLVDAGLRRELVRLARERGVSEIDLMGPLLDRLASVLGRTPLGRPGLYRALKREYFDRISAIDYTMAHDDGRKPEDWEEADVVIIGVSRTGKTPMSVYLSVLGWKAANCPIVPGLPIPDDLYRVDPSRVIGLTIDPDRLLSVRRQRIGHIGASEHTDYTDPARIDEEVLAAKRVFRTGGFSVINMTNRTVESCADEIIKRIGRPDE